MQIQCASIVNGDCDKGIVVIKQKNLTTIRCVNYEKKQMFEGYVKPEERTARQLKALMRFTQEY